MVNVTSNILQLTNLGYVVTTGKVYGSNSGLNALLNVAENEMFMTDVSSPHLYLLAHGVHEILWVTA